jgi:hypothetical protein
MIQMEMKMQNVDSKVLELFNAMVVKTVGKMNFDGVTSGYICDFVPTREQKSVMESACRELTIRTLFGRKERDTSSVFELVTKQILHYIEVYGLDSPGLFNLEVEGGTAYTLKFIRGITVDQLSGMVRRLAYTNAPIKDVVALKSIVDFYKIDININEVKNNEIRVVLFDDKTHVFNSGDDAVRYMCYKASGNALLIKSK